MTDLPDSLAQPLAGPAPAPAPPRLAPAPAPPRLGRLARGSDPGWVVFVGLLLLPVLLCQALGEPLKARFFLGLAIYLGVLKWLGWLVLPRVPDATAFARWPAELFAGLAVLCGWFYLRNLVGRFWPASYGLGELSFLAPVALAFNFAGRLPALLRRAYPAGMIRGRLLQALVCAPFVVALTAALWNVSGTLHAQNTDALYHAFSSRAYAADGLDFRDAELGSSLVYPSGFGAMNAVALAASPLAPVQAVQAQHVLWTIVGLFLVPAVIAGRTGRPLKPLWCLPLFFLTLCPVYALYPDIYYSATGRQAAPGLLAAVCLLPLIVAPERRWYLVVTASVIASLAAVTFALNPACAPFVALAVGIALVLQFRAAMRLGQRPVPSLVVQLVPLACVGLLLLANDLYYGRLVQKAGLVGLARHAPAPAQVNVPPEQPSAVGGFSLISGLRQAGGVQPLGLSPNATVGAFTSVELEAQTRQWPGRLPQCALPLLGAGLGLLALLAAWVTRRQQVPTGLRFLPPFCLGCLALWFVLKYGMTFLEGALSSPAWQGHLLRVYIGFLLLRCELLVLFALLVSAGTSLYLTLERRPGGRRVATLLLAPVIGVLLLCAVLVPCNCGTPIIPVTPWGRVSVQDLNLVAWIDQNLPPEDGALGLAAMVFEVGGEGQEKHVDALGGPSAVLLYGKPRPVRFALPALERRRGYEDYLRHIEEDFDAGWCLAHNIRHFYVSANSYYLSPDGRPHNRGIARAIDDGRLRLVHAEGSSGVYAVVAREAGR